MGPCVRRDDQEPGLPTHRDRPFAGWAQHRCIMCYSARMSDDPTVILILTGRTEFLNLTSATPAPLNRLRQQWREKRPTFGAIATIPSIQTVQIMARTGIDWIIVDLEHGPIDLGSAHAMITATSGTPCVPMVRIAANEPWLAKAPMDIGALGINFPMICSRADAEKAVRSVRYPPKRRPAVGPVSRAVPLGRVDGGLYGDRRRRHDLHDHDRACRGGQPHRRDHGDTRHRPRGDRPRRPRHLHQQARPARRPRGVRR